MNWLKNIPLGTSLAFQWPKLCLPMQEAQVQSLVRGLRSHMPHSQNTKTMRQKQYRDKSNKDFTKWPTSKNLLKNTLVQDNLEGIYTPMYQYHSFLLITGWYSDYKNQYTSLWVIPMHQPPACCTLRQTWTGEGGGRGVHVWERM